VEESVERTQRTYIKLALGVLIGFVLFVFLCWGGCRSYSVLESRHQTRRAAAYLSGGELRQAALSARRALQLNPSSPAVIRVLANVAERANDRTALDWRRKACELEPNSIEDRLALANCALQFNDVATAEKTLRQVNENARLTAEFHVATARLAEAKKEPGDAESHWAEAVKLAPNNKSYQLQFGLALLRIDNPAKRETGVAMLNQLRGDEKQRAPATRALIVDGAAHHAHGEKLAALARELQDYPGATFSDRLLYLDILRQLRDPQFTRYLTDIEKDAASNPANLASVLSWMNANGMSLLAIDFVRTLPNDVLAKWPIPLAIAESYSKLADWPGLESWVKNKSWDQFDFLRHAYLALALREEDKPVAADREWTAAQKQAGSQVQFLSMLSRAASNWGWQTETSELLWMLTKHAETRLEAFQELYQRYAETGDTPGLYRVLVRLAELEPEDMRIQNNLAQVSTLLNVDVERARKLAADIYRKEGSNPAYAATYAFALYAKGDMNGALDVMNRLNDSQLRDPRVAVYYGAFLAAVGHTQKAQEYLQLGASAKLLPEEKALIAKAERALK
jgi:hypothetical protein